MGVAGPAKVCVRDDDAKTFEFVSTSDSSRVIAQVAAALAAGRNVRCHVLSDEGAEGKEEGFLLSKGYRKEPVQL